MRLIFAGSGEFGLPSLKAIRTAGHEIVQVFTQPDRPAGRGRKMTPTPIAAYADVEMLAAKRTENINAEELPPCDVMVVIAFGQKIAPPAVNHPRLGSVNLHASRLPKYRRTRFDSLGDSQWGDGDRKFNHPAGGENGRRGGIGAIVTGNWRVGDHRRVARSTGTRRGGTHGGSITATGKWHGRRDPTG